jgi:hypothetical protein
MCYMGAVLSPYCNNNPTQPQEHFEKDMGKTRAKMGGQPWNWSCQYFAKISDFESSEKFQLSPPALRSSTTFKYVG